LRIFTKIITNIFVVVTLFFLERFTLVSKKLEKIIFSINEEKKEQAAQKLEELYQNKDKL